MLPQFFERLFRMTTSLIERFGKRLMEILFLGNAHFSFDFAINKKESKFLQSLQLASKNWLNLHICMQ